MGISEFAMLKSVNAQKGVSFIICTFNGAQRLPKTLENIISQQVSGGIPWEVIVINNGSTDDTQQVVRASWTSATIPLKIIREPQNIGIGRARLLGLDKAQYEYMVFVDDDNWIEKNWVTKIFEVMEAHPEVGACGAFSEAACESTPPAWFSVFKIHYAVGPEDQKCGYVSSGRGWLWSAGMTIRKSAWNQICQAGFKLHLMSRSIGNLLSGEDVEISYALRLAGWKLWFEPALKFQHFIENGKLRWEYLEKLHRGFGRTFIYFDLYRSLLGDCEKPLVISYGANWLFFQLRKILRIIMKDWTEILFKRQGSEQVLLFEREVGRLTEMFYSWDCYEKCLQDTLHYVAQLKNYLGPRYA